MRISIRSWGLLVTLAGCGGQLQQDTAPAGAPPASPQVSASGEGANPGPPVGPTLGDSSHRYRWHPGWFRPAWGSHVGPTHGEIVIAGDGRIVLSTDTDRAIQIYRPDGTFERTWGSEFASGVHGMTLHTDGGQERLYMAFLGGHQLVKASLDGDVLWRRDFPEASGKYGTGDEYKPTSVAVSPDGRVFVADGYGQHWIHRYTTDGTYQQTFGGPGSEPGQLNTPHGVWVDTRSQDPVLVVADRGNRRLQLFELDGTHRAVLDTDVRSPCKIQQWNEFLVVPDLEGRVTIVGPDYEVVTHLGDNPDPEQRAHYEVDPGLWRDGTFISPHSAAWDPDGNLYVMDWNAWGRVNRLDRVGGNG